jgi:hypothetical protein
LKHYWIRLFRGEGGEESVENCLVYALLIGIVCTAMAVSASRIRCAVYTAAVLPVRASIPTQSWNQDPPFDEQHWRIKGLAERWATGRETIRLVLHDDRGVIKIRGARKKSHTIYLIPPSVAQRIHAQLSGSDSPFEELHFRIRDLARRWALGREKVRLLIKDEPGVLRFRQGRLKEHTMYSVPESVAKRIYLRLQNAI